VIFVALSEDMQMTKTRSKGKRTFGGTLTVETTLHFKSQGKYDLNIDQLVDLESLVSPLFMRERHYWVGPKGTLETTVRRPHETELIVAVVVGYVAAKLLDGFLEKLGANVADFIVRQFSNRSRKVAKASVAIDGKAMTITDHVGPSRARVSVSQVLKGRRDKIEIKITVDSK
jgi:hypothetical protein